MGDFANRQIDAVQVRAAADTAERIVNAIAADLADNPKRRPK